MELKKNPPGTPESELRRQAEAFCKGLSIAVIIPGTMQSPPPVPERDLTVGHWYIHDGVTERFLICILKIDGWVSED